MTVQETEKYFGNLNRACIALKMTSQNATSWKKNNYIPWRLQFQLAFISKGALIPDEQDPRLAKKTN